MPAFRPKVEIWPNRACAMKKKQYNRYYKNSSVIVDLAMGEILRSTERMSSYKENLYSSFVKLFLCNEQMTIAIMITSLHNKLILYG